jgi:hypothetical protein
MSRPWFDATDGRLLLDEYVLQMPSWRSVIADGEVTDAEIVEQVHRVEQLLQQLERKLTADVKELATQALCELAVLSLLQHKRAGRLAPEPTA